MCLLSIIAGNTENIKTINIENLKTIDMGVIENFLSGLPSKAMDIGLRIVLAILFLLIGGQIIKLIRRLTRKSLTKTKADEGAVQFIDSFLNVALFVILFFMIATSFGLDAASVVAVLGSAGIAIGLALQGSLSNLAGGILILLLKPFKVGDYILEDSKKNEGTVTEIKVFYTKLMSFDGKIIILPNGALANNNILNLSANGKRRIDVLVGISYDADLKLAKEILNNIIQTDETVLKEEDTLVFVNALKDSSVELCARFWTKNEYFLSSRWNITEKVKLALDKNHVEIPYQQIQVHMRPEKKSD